MIPLGAPAWLIAFPGTRHRHLGIGPCSDHRCRAFLDQIPSGDGSIVDAARLDASTSAFKVSKPTSPVRARNEPIDVYRHFYPSVQLQLFRELQAMEI